MPFSDFVRTRTRSQSYWGVRGRIDLPASLNDVTPSDFFAFYIGFDILLPDEATDARVEAGIAHKWEIDGTDPSKWHWFVNFWIPPNQFSTRGPSLVRSQALLRLETGPPDGGLTPFWFYVDDQLVYANSASLGGVREAVPKYVSSAYQATPHLEGSSETEQPVIGYGLQASWDQVSYLPQGSDVWELWTSLNTVTEREGNTHRDNDGVTRVSPLFPTRFSFTHPAQYYQRTDTFLPAVPPPLPQCELIATIVRNAAGGATGKQIRVDRDRLLMLIDTGNEAELWRSDDRGVNWSFYIIPNSMGAHRSLTAISEPFSGNLWMSDGFPLAGQKYTPSDAPGSTWGEENAPNNTVYGQPGQAPNVFLHSQVLGLFPDIRRRTGPGTDIVIGSHDAGDPRGMRVIPGTGDLLALYNQPVKIFRLTPSNPMVIVNQTQFPEGNFSNPNFPNPNFDALTDTDYYVGLRGGAAGSDQVPVVIKRTTDGGGTWQNTQLAPGFWTGQSGDLAISGVTTCFARHDRDYVMVTRQELPRVRLGRFDALTNTWVPYSAECHVAVKFSGVGVDPSGILRFYYADYDGGTQRTRIFRYTIQV